MLHNSTKITSKTENAYNGKNSQVKNITFSNIKHLLWADHNKHLHILQKKYGVDFLENSIYKQI